MSEKGETEGPRLGNEEGKKEKITMGSSSIFFSKRFLDVVSILGENWGGCGDK